MSGRSCPNRLLLTILWGPILAGACSSGPPPSGKTLVALLDLSESTKGARSTYCDTIRDLLDSVHPGDAVAVGWITEHSSQELSLAVKEAIPPFEPGTDNPLMVKRLRAMADSSMSLKMDSIGEGLCERLAEPGRKVMNTDIMTSVNLASRVFASYPNVEKYLVIMSDMVEESDQFNFKTMSLSDVRRTEIIQSQSDGGRLPDLGGVMVYVVGAQAGSQTQYFEIRSFWKRYFAATGADLQDENYGGAMIRLPGE